MVALEARGDGAAGFSYCRAVRVHIFMVDKWVGCHVLLLLYVMVTVFMALSCLLFSLFLEVSLVSWFPALVPWFGTSLWFPVCLFSLSAWWKVAFVFLDCFGFALFHFCLGLLPWFFFCSLVPFFLFPIPYSCACLFAY